MIDTGEMSSIVSWDFQLTWVLWPCLFALTVGVCNNARQSIAILGCAQFPFVIDGSGMYYICSVVKHLDRESALWWSGEVH